MNAQGGLCLSDDELYELTHKKRFTARLRALNAMGIESRAALIGLSRSVALTLMRSSPEACVPIAHRRESPSPTGPINGRRPCPAVATLRMLVCRPARDGLTGKSDIRCPPVRRQIGMAESNLLLERP